MATNLTAQELQGYIRLLDAKNSNQEATRYEPINVWPRLHPRMQRCPCRCC